MPTDKIDFTRNLLEKKVHRMPPIIFLFHTPEPRKSPIVHSLFFCNSTNVFYLCSSLQENTSSEYHSNNNADQVSYTHRPCQIFLSFCCFSLFGTAYSLSFFHFIPFFLFVMCSILLQSYHCQSSSLLHSQSIPNRENLSRVLASITCLIYLAKLYPNQSYYG